MKDTLIPVVFVIQLLLIVDLAINLKLFQNISGMIYFLNTHTKKSQWDKPDGPAPLVDEEDDEVTPTSVQCSHLLVKHAGSRRPSSWREENITRTKEDALEMLRGLSIFKYFLISFILYLNKLLEIF